MQLYLQVSQKFLFFCLNCWLFGEFLMGEWHIYWVLLVTSTSVRILPCDCPHLFHLLSRITCSCSRQWILAILLLKFEKEKCILLFIVFLKEIWMWLVTVEDLPCLYNHLLFSVESRWSELNQLKFVGSIRFGFPCKLVWFLFFCYIGFLFLFFCYLCYL